jgi:hydrogenase nickel incorporation protein HypB
MLTVQDQASRLRELAIESDQAGEAELADLNQGMFRRAGTLAVELVGAPGCGKTSLIEATLRRAPSGMRCGAVVGERGTHRDAERLAASCRHIVEEEPGIQSQLAARDVHDALLQMHLEELDVVFIETVGVTRQAAALELGQTAKVAVFSVVGGDDKAVKYPQFVENAELVLINKIDLLPHVRFDADAFRADVRRLNPGVPILETSVATGQGIDAWMNWLQDRRRALLPAEARQQCGCCSELYVG